MATDFMIDLETLGTVPERGVPLLSIGWCAWDRRAATFDHVAAQVFIKASPGEADEATKKWWLDQGARWAAIEDRCEREGVSLEEAMTRLTTAFRMSGAECVWSHGASFDVVILEYWFRRLGLNAPPWKFYNIRDTRTLYHLGAARLPKNTHDAMEDAINQARLVHSIWRRLDEPRRNTRPLDASKV